MIILRLSSKKILLTDDLQINGGGVRPADPVVSSTFVLAGVIPAHVWQLQEKAGEGEIPIRQRLSILRKICDLIAEYFLKACTYVIVHPRDT